MKKIIFDLDNTLLFISEDWKNDYQIYIDKYNLNTTPLELFPAIETIEKNCTNMLITKEFFINYLHNKISIDLTIEMLDDLLDIYARVPLLRLDEVYDTLTYLSKHYELIAYTNWFTDNQILRLKLNNLDKFFSKVYGWETLPVKPSKEGILSIIGNDNPSDYIFIGDSIDYDIKVPYEMGIETIFFNRKSIKQDKYKQVFSVNELKDVLKY